MKGRFISGLTAGALIGAAAGIFLMPGMDRRTKKRIMKAGRMIAGFTEDIWDELKDFRR